MALPGRANVTLTIGAKDNASGVLKRIGGGITGFAKVAAAAVAGAAAAFVGLGAISIKSAISVQSAFTGVAKTTEGLVTAGGELTAVGEEIKQSFRDLAKEVPIAVEELLGIGELAGQLGVPREAIVEFSEVVAALGVTTNLTTEEAATDLARLANIYQISAEDMAANTERIGSVIVDLGNNFATTERDILAFGQRIAAAGSIAGIAQEDVLAIGAAMASVGIEAEAGGTAVQKVLITMVKAVAEGGDELDAFAKATGQSAAEFRKAFEEDAAGVFEDFVLSLGKEGDKAILVLKELGLEDQRLSRAFLSLAGAGDLITRSMDTASEAFETNEALGKEAQLRYGTMDSQLVILKNTLKDVGVTIGDALLPFLSRAIEFVEPFIEEFGEKLPQFIEENLMPALEDVGKFFSEDLPVIAAGVAETLEPITIGLGELVDAFIDSAPEIEEAWTDITNHFKTFVTPSLQQSFDNIGEGLIGLGIAWRENDNIIISSLAIAVQLITTLLAELLLIITSTFKIITLVITGEWEAAWNEVMQTFIQSMELFFGLFNTEWDEFARLWTQILTDISTILTLKLNQWSADIQDFLDGVLLDFSLWALDIIGTFKDWASGVAQSIGDVLDKIEELGKAVVDFILPPWLFGGSPGDFELGLRGISKEMANLGRTTRAAFQPITEGPGGLASQRSRINGDVTQMQDHLNLTVNTRARTEDVVQTFESMKSLRAGAI